MKGLKLDNCRRCGRLFSSAGVEICPECIEKEEEQYALLKEFLLENPRATVSEASKATGVPAGVITDFLRRGLLAQVNLVLNTELVCRICKAPVPSGFVVCPECQRKLQAPLRAREAQAAESSQRMYYNDIITRRRT